MGGNAKSITQHSLYEVVEKHYLNKEAVAKAAVRFNVFKQSSRYKQLENVRSNYRGSKIEKKGIGK